LEEKREREMQRTLENWAVGALARWAKVPAPSGTQATAPPAWLSAYGKLLSRNWAPDGRGDRLLSVFGLIKAQSPGWQPKSVNPRRLSLEGLLEGQAESPDVLWADFPKEYASLPAGAGRFETFGYLLQKYAWAVPCTYGDEYLSLYEEFKALAALVYASDGAEAPAEKALLVGGDIPGIQDFVYTITSRGAAKGLRGRSFFLQLLVETLMRATLRELGLPQTSVVYCAGGNFKLLAPMSAKALLLGLKREINARLLSLFKGELHLAMAWVDLKLADALRDEGFAAANDDLAAALEQAKRSAFAELLGGSSLASEYATLFAAQGIGGTQFCDVCHIDLPTGETRCAQCSGFEELASVLASLEPGDEMQVFETKKPLGQIPFSPLPATGRPTWWQVTLSFGYNYGFGASSKGMCAQRLRLNSTEFLPASPTPDTCYGFRFLANSTPRIQAREIDAIRHSLEAEEEAPSAGNIRDTTIMADYDATGIPRYGVLRMDVDNLGSVLRSGLEAHQARDLAHISALSTAISLFFDGLLDQLCAEAAESWACWLAKQTNQPKKTNAIDAIRPYVIYAGGDDLFIVAYWDVLPVLARHIRDQWHRYTLGRLTVSAGMALAAAKFPLYRLAELSKAQLEQSKDRVAFIHGNEIELKDACTFLGVTLGWPEMATAEELAMQITSMLATRGTDPGAPRSLLGWLGRIAALYDREAESSGANSEVVFGRWMWMLVYGLSRLARGIKSDWPRDEIIALRNRIMDDAYAPNGHQLRIPQFLGLPVRWADMLTRREK
jgi:CRISPR-associated protein Csm1